MIIGNGLLANAFKCLPQQENSVIIFASGVSNSKEFSKAAFDREKNLLLKSIKDDAMLVYFSKPYPARAVVGVVALPKNALIEIESKRDYRGAFIREIAENIEEDYSGTIAEIARLQEENKITDITPMDRGGLKDYIVIINC